MAGEGHATGMGVSRATVVAACLLLGTPCTAEPLLLRLHRADLDHAPDHAPAAAMVDVGGASLPGIDAAAPSRIVFRSLRVPAGGALLLKAGIPERVVPGAAAVRFRVSVLVGGVETDVWSKSVRETRFIPVRVPLGPWEGKTIDLVLATECAAGIVRAAWADVLLSPEGWAPDEPRETVVDLLGSVTGAARGAWAARVDVPEDGMLELAASRPAEPGRGAVEVAAWVDGVEVLRRSVGAPRAGGFRAAIPLPDAAGRNVEVCLYDGGAPTRGSWQTVRVVRRPEALRAAASSPNVMVLLVDTLRADRLGAYGHPDPASPHLDRLSRRGELFTRVTAQSSWTLPSVESLFTGSYPARGAGSGRSEPEGRPTRAVPRAKRARVLAAGSLADAFWGAGWETLAVVANPLLHERGGLTAGFRGYACLGGASSGAVYGLFDAWLQGRRGSPWFAYLHVMEPHGPYLAGPGEWALVGPPSPQGDLAAVYQAASRWSREMLDPEIVPVMERAYGPPLLVWDAELGRLVARLRRSGALEDLVMAVTADHGEELFEHGLLGHGRQLYQESIHVPLLLVDGSPASLNPAPRELRTLGGDLARRAGVRFEQDVPPPGETLSLLTRTSMVSLSDGSWKLVQDEAGRPSLYHLDSDPQETRDHAGAEPATVERLRARLRQLLGTGAPAPAEVDAETLERMRALGYVP